MRFRGGAMGFRGICGRECSWFSGVRHIQDSSWVNPRYRPDIDGLRALAVGLVVLQHAGLGPFPGGYIGVDVFFVISGYLISGLVVADLDRGRFSFREFYERRARRILPALLVMLLTTTLVALALMPPTELVRFAKTLPPTLLFYANRHMAGLGGYFGPGVQDVPLLHLWSIAVEEQFYIVFPLVCWGLHRYAPRRLRQVVLLAVIILFAYACLRMMQRPDKAYFGTGERAWELLLGAAIRLYPLRDGLMRRLAGPLGGGGLALILACAVLFEEDAGVPGPAGLGPTLGAAWILVAGGVGPISRLLAAAPLVALGRRSYALYLWHWPVLVFAGFFLPNGMPISARVALVVMAVALAALTYHFVETPSRRLDGPVSRPQFTRLMATAAAALIAFLVGIRASDGLSGRLPPATLAAIASTKAEADRHVCRGSSAARDGETCPAQPHARTLLIGDSHARSLAAGLAAVGTSFELDWVSHCPPVASLPPKTASDLWRREGSIRAACATLAPKRTAAWLASAEIDTVVLALFWRSYPNDFFRHDTGADGPAHAAIVAEIEAMARAYTATGKRVVIVGPVPHYPRPIVVEMQRAAIGLPSALGMSRRRFETETAGILAGLNRMARLPRVEIVYAHEALCDTESCAVVRDGRPLYVDDDHLSRAGAALVAPQVKAAVARLDRTAPTRNEAAPATTSTIPRTTADATH